MGSIQISSSQITSKMHAKNARESTIQIQKNMDQCSPRAEDHGSGALSNGEQGQRPPTAATVQVHSFQKAIDQKRLSVKVSNQRAEENGEERKLIISIQGTDDDDTSSEKTHMHKLMESDLINHLKKGQKEGRLAPELNDDESRNPNDQLMYQTMLTHTFESSTSEYHQSTIHSDNDEASAIERKEQSRRKKTKKLLKNLMKDANKKKKLNMGEERNQFLINKTPGSNGQKYTNPILSKKREQTNEKSIPNSHQQVSNQLEVPHHLQEQQSSQQSGDVQKDGNTNDPKLSVKLDTAFEKNFREMEAKIKSLPKGGKAGFQNFQYVASEDDFGGIEVASPQIEIMKKLGAQIAIPIEGPPVVKDQTYYRQFQEDQKNDVKLKRDQFLQNRDNMANNTFIKLFQGSNNDSTAQKVNNDYHQFDLKSSSQVRYASVGRRDLRQREGLKIPQPLQKSLVELNTQNQEHPQLTAASFKHQLQRQGMENYKIEGSHSGQNQMELSGNKSRTERMGSLRTNNSEMPPSVNESGRIIKHQPVQNNSMRNNYPQTNINSALHSRAQSKGGSITINGSSSGQKTNQIQIADFTII